VPLEQLRDEGWARVSFDGFATVLEAVDVPLELTQSGTVIAMSSVAAAESVMGLWADVVHPNSAMRARVGGESVISELSLGASAHYVLTTHVGSRRMAVLTKDRVAAELIGRSLIRLREAPLGVEAVGPWEEPTVQHLIEIGAGITSATALRLKVVGEGIGDNEIEPLRQLAEWLGCRIDGAGMTT
jgi:hypothetical protein